MLGAPRGRKCDRSSGDRPHRRDGASNNHPRLGWVSFQTLGWVNFRALPTLVLGIEGFYVDGDKIYPAMEAIADFSQLTNSEETILEARAFLTAVGHPGLLLDVTVSKPIDG